MKRKQFKIFISYSSDNKKYADKIKEQLTEIGIECFLAHEDINVSDKWMRRIIMELKRTDIIIALLSKSFKSSDWTQMEIGALLQRKVLVIPLSIDGTHSFGFIRDIQSKSIAEAIPLDYLLVPILECRRFSQHMTRHLIDRLKIAGSFADAEKIMDLLSRYFKLFRQTDVSHFIDNSMANEQVWSANECRKHIKTFIKKRKKYIRKNRLPEIYDKIEGPPFYERVTK